MEHECKRCGHKWESRVEKPQCCPRCKSYVYMKEDTRNGKA
jgi:predicted Zn-ribbon and HTH transcriptional regulator